MKFTIQREVSVYGDLGRQYLTPERRKALAQYDESELFSNKIRFCLLNNATGAKADIAMQPASIGQ